LASLVKYIHHFSIVVHCIITFPVMPDAKLNLQTISFTNFAICMVAKDVMLFCVLPGEVLIQ
jgi:hypothetical protein